MLRAMRSRESCMREIRTYGLRRERAPYWTLLLYLKRFVFAPRGPAAFVTSVIFCVKSESYLRKSASICGWSVFVFIRAHSGAFFCAFCASLRLTTARSIFPSAASNSRPAASW